MTDTTENRLRLELAAALGEASGLRAVADRLRADLAARDAELARLMGLLRRALPYVGVAFNQSMTTVTMGTDANVDLYRAIKATVAAADRAAKE